MIREFAVCLGRCTGATLAAVFPRRRIMPFTEATHRRNWSVGRAEPQEGREHRPCTGPGPALAAHLYRHPENRLSFEGHLTTEATDSKAEQVLRPAVVNRKAWSGNRTRAGATTRQVSTPAFETGRRDARHTPDLGSSIPGA